MFALISVFAFTKLQVGITVAVAIVLAGLIAGDFIVLYSLNKEHRKLLTEQVDTLREHSEDLRVKLTETREVSENLRVHLSETQEARENLRVRLSAVESQASTGNGSSRLKIRAKEDNSDDDNIMHYNRSFRARLIQSQNDMKEWYSDIKNMLLSYKDMKSSIAWKWESFRMKRNTLVKLMIRGKSLCVYMPQEVLDLQYNKIRIEDASGMSTMKDTPVLVRIKSEKHCARVLEILTEIMAKFGAVKVEREAVDYFQPYCGTLALIKKGLVKRVVRDAGSMPGRKPEPAPAVHESKPDSEKPAQPADSPSDKPAVSTEA